MYMLQDYSVSGETLSENKLIEVNHFTLQHVINLHNQFLT